MHCEARHALTMEGTSPSMVTRASTTNSPNARPSGAPSNSAMQAPLSRLAYTSHGPMTQPREVGQHTTSPRRTSWCAHASSAALSGVTWLHGMALGWPVVPDENMIIVHACASQVQSSSGAAAR